MQSDQSLSYWICKFCDVLDHVKFTDAGQPAQIWYLFAAIFYKLLFVQGIWVTMKENVILAFKRNGYTTG